MNPPPWHSDNWRGLVARWREKRLAHGLLFCGPHGLDKRGFTERFAATLLCERVDANACACERCRSCKLLAAGSHPDLIRVNLTLRDDGTARKEIAVDQIRTLSERLAMTAQFGGMQIALIDPADAMNVNAANALLKTLEEPTAATLILLVADEPARLPATIRSRCQRIEFRLPPRLQAREWLMGQGLDGQIIDTALQASGGNPGLALEWAGNGGLTLREEVAADLRALHSGRTSAIQVADRWAREQPDARLWFMAALAQVEAASNTAGRRGPLALTPPADLTKLEARFDLANRARARLRGPLRAELVVLDALAAWQPVQPSSDHRRGIG